MSGFLSARPRNVGDPPVADPFEVLLRANNVLLNNLRRDEVSPELQKQLAQTGMSPSAHAYFCDPYANSYLGPQFLPKTFVTLPAPLARERDRVECMNLMGLLPEIDHAWMTVDNVLFLWNYHTKAFTQLREVEQGHRWDRKMLRTKAVGLDDASRVATAKYMHPCYPNHAFDVAQVLVTVALVPPKRGVIQDSVAHMLVVATTTEVRLFAVMYDSASTSKRKRPIHFKPTNFKASTEGVSMLKIVGHANGRVFMAGKDGNLYELTYTVEYGFMYSVFYLGDSTGARKCKRLRHKSSGAPPSPVHALLALMGLRSADRTLVDIAVDSLRNVLYTLDLEGNMDLFDLGSSGNHTAQKMSRFNIWDAASKFCRWGSHSNLMPDQSIFKKPRKFNVVSMNVVDPTESRDVSLVVISDAGMRFYLSCNYSTSLRHNLQLSIVHIRCPPPEALWKYFVHPRSQSAPAPVPATPDGSSNGGLRSYVKVGGLGAGNGVVAHQQRQTQPPDGFPAKWERQGSSTPAVYGAYSSHGVTVMAETVGNKNRLIFIGADVVTRSKRRREAQQEEHPWMREAVAVEGGESSGDSIFTRKVGQVWAIAERPVLLMDDPEAMRVRSSIVTSRAPSQADMNSRGNPSGGAPASLRSSSSRASSRQAGSGSGGSNSSSSGGRSTSTALVVRKAAAGVGVGVVHRAMEWGKEETYPERPVAPGPPLICCPEGSKGFPRGLLPKDLGRIVALPELGSQLFSAKREILCLTSAGLHTFVKLRPVDMLYELVAQPNNEKVQWFCEDFSRDQTMAMCFSIACGLPGDLGALFSTAGEYADVVPSASAGVAAHELRKLALDAALKNCEPPCFSSPQAGGGSGGPIVMESVTIGEKFNNSALHNGLQLFTSRLLRPFWFQQVVKLSASTGSARNSGSKRSSDGKAKDGGGVGAPSFLDVRALRGPLELLKDAIRAVFPRSVENDLAAEAAKSAMQASAAAEDVARMSDRRLGFASRDSRATGRGLLYGSDRVGGMIDARRHGSPGVGLNGRGGAGGGMSIGSGIGSAGRQPETPSQRSQKALKLEAMEVHASYRLVTRALDAVRMIRVLTRVAEDFPKAKVPWIGLSGIALWKLVTGGEEHRRVSSLLADLVGPKVDLAPDARSALARELGTECPSYFSQGDARTFEGIELLRRAGSRARLGGWIGPEAAAPGQLQKLPPPAANDAEQGVALLLEAAKDWKGERALGNDGQLARACAALSEVGRLDNVVDVCMTCSNNFKDGDSTSTAIVPVDSMGRRSIATSQGLRSARPGHTGNSLGGSGVSGDAPSWEEGVYQGGAVVEPSDREKARVECYERVLDTVLALLRPNPAGVPANRAGSSAEGPSASDGGSSVNGTEGRSAASSAIVPVPVGPPAELDRLIDRCLSYNVPDLNAKLFERLEAHDKSLLLRMKTQMTERHLEKDPDMLYRYFMLHKEFPKAVFLMDRLAHADPSPEVHVRDRVDCLSKAISACHKCDLESSRVVMPGWSLNYGKLQALKDERDVLLVQERLLRDLQASMDPLDRLEGQGRGTELLDGELSDRRDLAYEWRTKIVDPTELYSKASAFFLWEGCLHLLQCCEKDEPAVARKLIRSVIWREVPTKSRDGEDSRVQEFLNRARNRPAEIDVDDVRQEVDRAFPAKRGARGEGGEESAKAGRLFFEDDWWFDPLLDKMAGLVRELLGRKAKYVLPIDTLLLELQDIADKYHGAGGPAPATCVVTRARQAGIPAVALLDVYEAVTRHSYPLEENRRLRMLEVLVQLLKWTFEEPQPGLFAETVPMERLERIAFDCMSALNSLDLSAIDESQANYKVDNLKLRLETLLGAMKAEHMKW